MYKIASMTCIKDRLSYLKNVLISLLNQIVEFDYIYVYYQGDLKDINIDLMKLSNKIKFISVDSRNSSFSKYIYSLKNFNKDIIITCDDDIIYRECFLQKLLSKYDTHKDNLICNCYSNIDKNYNYFNPVKLNECQSYYILPYTGWGVLIPPNFYNNNLIFDEKIYLDICPYCDEIWLWINCLLNNKMIYCHGEYNNSNDKNPWYNITKGNITFKKCLYNIYSKMKKEDLINKYKKYVIDNKIIK